MTVLQIVNRILRRLREDTVQTLTENPYSTLITEFVADVHEELLQHEWSSMQHTVEVPVDALQRTLDLSRLEVDGGDVEAGSRLPTTNSILYWAKVFDDNADTEGCDLIERTPEELEDRYQQDRDYVAQDPLYIAFRNHPDRDGVEAILWPPPATSRHIRIRMWTPEAPIDADADDARTLLVPSRPLQLGALYLALNERGEELGEPGGVAERRYYDSVGIALEADVNRRARTGRFTAERE